MSFMHNLHGSMEYYVVIYSVIDPCSIFNSSLDYHFTKIDPTQKYLNSNKRKKILYKMKRQFIHTEIA